MEMSLRPWVTTGIAVVSASAIAVAPISPVVPQARAAEAQVAHVTRTMDVDLAAIDWPYILSLPIVRQQIRNWAQNWAVYLGGLSKSGVGIAQSLLSIPGVTIEVIQELFALNFVGAFETVTQAIRDSVVAIGQPLLDSVIWRNQKYYVVEAALRAAYPQAIIDVTNGFLVAGNTVVTSLIEGTQNLVAAILSFDLSNIVDAAVDGTVGFVQALGTGARSIVDGIESAQKGIADALATPPPPPPDFSDISTLRTFDETNTLTITSKEAEVQEVSPTLGDPVEVVSTPLVETPPESTEAQPPATPVVDPEPEPEPEPTAKPKPQRPRPIRDALTKLRETVEKVTGVDKHEPAEKPADPKPADKPAPDKPSSEGSEGE